MAISFTRVVRYPDSLFRRIKIDISTDLINFEKVVYCRIG